MKNVQFLLASACYLCRAKKVKSQQEEEDEEEYE